MKDGSEKMVFDGIDSVRLLAAFQVLALEDRALGARHEDARHWVLKLTGREYDRHRSVKGTMPLSADLRGWLEWHFSERGK